MDGCRGNTIEDEHRCEIAYARLAEIKKERLEVIEARYAEWQNTISAEEAQFLVANQRIQEAPSSG